MVLFYEGLWGMLRGSCRPIFSSLNCQILLLNQSWCRGRGFTDLGFLMVCFLLLLDLWFEPFSFVVCIKKVWLCHACSCVQRVALFTEPPWLLLHMQERPKVLYSWVVKSSMQTIALRHNL